VRTASRLAVASISLACLAPPAEAGAAEVEIAGQPLVLDVTNTAFLNGHFDNRDDAAGNVGTLLNDDYFEWLDRFNVQLSYRGFRVGLRMDGAVYAGTPSQASIDALVNDQTSSRNDYRNNILRELHSRYLRTFYPAKLYVGYNRPGVDVTVGDFYAQLGRGLVFSARKIDELSYDTSVRGAKVVADHMFGPIRLAGTLFVGQMNPVRIDELTGRRVHGTGSPFFFGYPRSGDLRTVETDGTSPVALNVIDRARPSYIEDTAIGGRIEGGTRAAVFAVNTSVLAHGSHQEDYLRCLDASDDETRVDGTLIRGQCAAKFPDFNPSPASTTRKFGTIATFSGSANLTSIPVGKNAALRDLYLEIAGQQLRDGRILSLGDASGGPLTRLPDLSGYAVYATGTFTDGPFSVLLEAKHYRRFFPLQPNIDTGTPGFGIPELSLLVYNQPPTVESIYTEPVAGASPNVCITGGRARVDYRFSRSAAVYAWLGRYASWSEVTAVNADCKMTENLRTDTWDSAIGVDLLGEKKRSHARAWFGARSASRTEPSDTRAGLTDAFYREGYLRYDLVKHLAGPFSLQLQGVHRKRFEPSSFANAWFEGENYTSLQWSPHISAVFGYEYVARSGDGCRAPVAATLTHPAQPRQDICHFVNGGLQWRSVSNGGVLGQIFDTVGIFVGQRRGALRCISGICRQVPAFEGAKLELTSRF
jgi:Family of unknown function (DUF6029)